MATTAVALALPGLPAAAALPLGLVGGALGGWRGRLCLPSCAGGEKQSGATDGGSSDVDDGPSARAEGVRVGAGNAVGCSERDEAEDPHPTGEAAMRMMLKAVADTAAGNAVMADGSISQVIGRLVEELHPEAAYFTSEDGRRACFMVFDMTDAATLPSICEPLFQAGNG